MRVLMLSPHPAVRGPIPRHTPVLVEAMRSLGCQVTMEPWGRHRDDESLVDKLVRGLGDVSRVRRQLRGEGFDVMVVKTSHEGRSLVRALPMLLATRRLVPKIIVQFHGGRSDLLVSQRQLAFKAASKALFRLCDGVLVLSSEEARESQRFWSQGQFRVVSNPYVPSSVEDHSGPDRNGRGQHPLTLLFVGRLITEKGIFEMLTAFASVSKNRDCRLVVVGDGPDSADVERSVVRLGLADRVELRGLLSGESLHEAYGSADVFVLPSYREGFPTAITEALAAGLPVITTRTRGMADHLCEGVHALFVEPRDARGLTIAVDRILADDALRRRMSVANVRKLADFEPESVARQYIAAVTEIVNGDDRAH